MAKQIGDIKLTGTIDNLTFYKMGEAYYVRMKSNITRKRFFKDAAFEGSRKSSQRLATGSKLASLVYRGIPIKKRRYSVYCELKSMAIRLLKEGSSERDALMQLEKEMWRKSKRGNQESKMVKRHMPYVFKTMNYSPRVTYNERSGLDERQRGLHGTPNILDWGRSCLANGRDDFLAGGRAVQRMTEGFKREGVNGGKGSILYCG